VIAHEKGSVKEVLRANGAFPRKVLRKASNIVLKVALMQKVLGGRGIAGGGRARKIASR
jgi:hypothetical protein